MEERVLFWKYFKDWIGQKLKQTFCHHEYYGFGDILYGQPRRYRCLKCGRIVEQAPNKLIVKQAEKENKNVS